MRTDDVIAMLAQGAGPARSPGDGWRIAVGMALAWPVMVLAVAVGLGLNPLANWGASATVPKLMFGATVTLAALWLVRRAGRPGASVAAPVAVVLAVAVLAVAAGLADLARVPPEARGTQLMGRSWSACPPLILGLSLPLQAGMIWAARALAPTRPGLAGLAGGLVAGGLAAAAYALHCDEGAVAFVALWYSLGIVLSGLLGMVAGKRLLRW